MRGFARCRRTRTERSEGREQHAEDAGEDVREGAPKDVYNSRSEEQRDMYDQQHGKKHFHDCSYLREIAVVGIELYGG